MGRMESTMDFMDLEAAAMGNTMDFTGENARIMSIIRDIETCGASPRS